MTNSQASLNGDSDELKTRIERLERQAALTDAYVTNAVWRAIDGAYEIGLHHRQLTCIVCGREGRRDDFGIFVDQCRFGGGKLERYQCPECDCIFGPQKYLDLDDAFVDLDYRLLYSRYSESDSTANEISTFRSLSPARELLFLDWGCGGAWSQTIDSLRSEGYDVWGYEPSAETASAYVVNRRAAISARFHGIFSNNVIEHFRDPVSHFKEFHALLTDGGKMAHSSPCYKYEYAFTRFHTLFLLGKSPHVLAKRTGFRVSDRFEDGEYINVVFERINEC